MKIYVAHAYRGNARANRAVCRRIAKHIWQRNGMPKKTSPAIAQALGQMHPIVTLGYHFYEDRAELDMALHGIDMADLLRDLLNELRKARKYGASEFDDGEVLPDMEKVECWLWREIDDRGLSGIVG